MRHSLLRIPRHIRPPPRKQLCRAPGHHLRQQLFSTQKTESDDPLRILFCGTDDFSAQSLFHLHQYAQSSDSNIRSIDVVTKTDKRTGRGRSTLTPPYIKNTAELLNLNLHQIDTFTGWQPPTCAGEGCNLVIAVSFGLLVPPRILGGAKYGGLNVHPSLLPDLRGPAPIEWTILNGRQRTGVSVQTLHPSKFDEGVVLAQEERVMVTPGSGGYGYFRLGQGLTDPNKIWAKDPEKVTARELRQHLARLGGTMLVDAIREKLYMPPHKSVVPHSPEELSFVSGPISHAPKLERRLCAVDFEIFTARDILRRNRALGTLYAHATGRGGRSKQINFDHVLPGTVNTGPPTDLEAAIRALPSGLPYAVVRAVENVGECSQPLHINTKPGRQDLQSVVLPEITVSGMAKGAAAKAAAQSKLFGQPAEYEDWKLYTFRSPLTKDSSSLQQMGIPRTTKRLQLNQYVSQHLDRVSESS